MDYAAEMDEANTTVSDAELMKLILFRLGVCDARAIDGLEHADRSMFDNFWAGLMAGNELPKLVDYLRQ